MQKNTRVFIRKSIVLLAAVLVIALIGAVSYLIADIIIDNVAGVHTAEQFGIETIKASVDFNGNGVDDYTDMVNGARRYVETSPTYNGDYVAGGYPPKGQGVCTDVIWVAFMEAGYCLKDMVDEDIAGNTELYTRVNGAPDPNIDFRRVSNLNVYFSRFAQELTLDTDDIAQWQPGDIVVYENLHIALVSDKRNYKGEPYIIHNGGRFTCGEQDRLKSHKIIGHYRFDASLIAEDALVEWNKAVEVWK